MIQELFKLDEIEFTVAVGVGRLETLLQLGAVDFNADFRQNRRNFLARQFARLVLVGRLEHFAHLLLALLGRIGRRQIDLDERLGDVC